MVFLLLSPALRAVLGILRRPQRREQSKHAMERSGGDSAHAPRRRAVLPGGLGVPEPPGEPRECRRGAEAFPGAPRALPVRAGRGLLPVRG